MTTATRTSWLTKIRLAAHRSWKLRRQGIVDPTDFGAKADGVHDDTGAWKDAIRYAEQARTKPPRLLVRRGSWHHLLSDVDLGDTTVEFE